MSEQVVCQQHRLGVLQMGAAWHDCALVGFCLGNQCVNYVPYISPNDLCVLAQIDADECGDLVVAAAASTKLATEFGTELDDEGRFERAVHIFIGVCGLQSATDPVGFERIEPSNHLAEFVSTEVTSRGKRASVCTRAGEVIGCELPIEVSGTAQLDKLRRRATGKAGAPQCALVRCTVIVVSTHAFCSNSQFSSAFCACKRFSASSQITLCGPSSTSAETS